jgi:predicted nucleic acid-binding Zn ribbon protein
MSDEPLTQCEVCGGQVSKVLFAPAIHFKGTGFHNTDYGSRRRGAGEDGGGSGSGEGTSSGEGTGNGASSGDGKRADKPAAASAGSSGGGKTVGLDKV